MGSVYRDLNDSPNAVTYFLKSISIAEENNEIDSIIWENAYSQLSYLYMTQLNYTEALNTILKGLNVAKVANIANERTYMSVSNRFYDLNDTIQTIKYANMALDLIERKKDYINNADIIANLMGRFSKYGYKQNAKYCYQLLGQLNESQMPHNYLINLATYYESNSSIDSAAITMLELYNNAYSIEAKYDATRWLTMYHNTITKNYKKVAYFAIEFIKVNDELLEKMSLEQTTNAKNLYQYKRDKDKELLIIQNAANDRLHLLFVILISTLILLGGLVIYYYRKKKLLNIITNKEESIKQIKNIITHKNNELIIEKQNIEKIERELSNLSSKNIELSILLQKANNDFNMLVSQNSELTKRTLMKNMQGEDKEIIEKCLKTSIGKYNLNEEEWKELLGVIDKQYPEFTYEIQARFKKINEPMLRICYLLKIGFSKPEIAKITNYPRQTVWYRVKQIKRVMGDCFQITNKELK